MKILKSHFFILCIFSLSVQVSTQAATTAVKPKVVQNANSKTITYNFTSCFDGNVDFCSLRPAQLSVPSPTNNAQDKTGRPLKAINADSILLVYFHSLTGDFNELFQSPLADAINKSFPNLSLLSCNYGHTPSWGIAPARLDITNNIRQIMRQHEVKHIVLVGTSMGASTALTYAATAPKYIKDKIIGIVAVAPCADLDDLYQKSLAPEVKPSLEMALKSNPADKPGLYHQNSLDASIAFLPPTIKIAVITAKEDVFIPLELQTNVVRDLNNRDMNVKSFELEGKSIPPPVDSILEGLRFVLQ